MYIVCNLFEKRMSDEYVSVSLNTIKYYIIILYVPQTVIMLHFNIITCIIIVMGVFIIDIKRKKNGEIIL